MPRRGGFTLADLTQSSTPSPRPLAVASDAYEGAEAEEANNDGIVLAPFNAGYEQIEDDLRTTGAHRPHTPGTPLAQCAPINRWDRFTISEPLDLRSGTLPGAASHAAIDGAIAAAATLEAPAAQASSGPSTIAIGGRRGKTTRALHETTTAAAAAAAAAGAGVLPLLQTFPALQIPPVLASPSPSAASPVSSASASSLCCDSVVLLLSPRDFWPCPWPHCPSDVAATTATANSARLPPQPHPFPLPLPFTEALSARHTQAQRTRALLDRALGVVPSPGSLHAVSSLSASALLQLQSLIEHDCAVWLQLEFPAGFLTNVLRAEKAATHEQRPRTSNTLARQGEGTTQTTLGGQTNPSYKQQHTQQQTRARHNATDTQRIQPAAVVQA
jgi:hypothetical protein